MALRRGVDYHLVDIRIRFAIYAQYQRAMSSPKESRMPRQSIAIRIKTLTAIGMSVLFMVSCSSPAVSVSVKPADGDQARDLAAAVADRANCSDLESLNLTDTKGTWLFSCQKGSATFDLTVFASDEAKKNWQRDHGKELQVAEHYYVVTLASTPGQTTSSALLEPFRSTPR